MPAETQAPPPPPPPLCPPAMRFPCGALGRHPFIWASLSPGISFPTPISAGLAMGGQGYTGGTREEVTSQRGSWKRCPEIQQRTAEEEGGHGEVSFVAPGLSNP